MQTLEHQLVCGIKIVRINKNLIPLTSAFELRLQNFVNRSVSEMIG